MTITLRQTKGSALTHDELDENFIDLTPQVDGFTWDLQTTPTINLWTGVIYGNGIFVAIGYNGFGNLIMTSSDGIHWASQTSAENNIWTSITYGDGLFVGVAADGTNRVMTSPDGITWTARAVPLSSWWDVTYANGLFVAVSDTPLLNSCMTSPDGITWTQQTIPVANKWTSVIYGNGLYVAVSNTGTGDRVMSSPDGITWTSRTSASDNNWQSVAYGDGLFVASSITGARDRIMTSPDGITWTPRTTPTDDQWWGITYGNGLFISVGKDVAGSGTQNVMTSNDGITWSIRDGAANNIWTNVIYGNGMFVAVSSSGIGSDVMTSGFTIETINKNVHQMNGGFDSPLSVGIGTAGNVAAIGTADDLVVENSTSGGISVLVPDTATGSLVFGTPTDTFGADLNWDFNTLLLSLRTASAGASMRFNTGNGTEAIRIDLNQDVGIGTITPSSRLHVQDATAIITADSTAVGNGAVVDLTNSTDVQTWRISGTDVLFKIRDNTAAVDVVTIDKSQRVGIGTTQPLGKLHVVTADAGAVTASGNAAELVLESNTNAGMSILTPDGNTGNIYFGSPSDNLGARVAFNYTGATMFIGTNRTNGVIQFESGNGALAMFIAADQGMYMQGATGASQGLGTINAIGVYDDGVLLTCYVPHYIADGKIDLNEWDGFVPDKENLKTFHEPARRFLDDVGNRIDVEKFTDFWKTKKHLPTMPSKEEWVEEGPLPTGKMIQKLWETVELQAAHIDQLLTRIEALEKAA